MAKSTGRRKSTSSNRGEGRCGGVRKKDGSGKGVGQKVKRRK